MLILLTISGPEDMVFHCPHCPHFLPSSPSPLYQLSFGLGQAKFPMTWKTPGPGPYFIRPAPLIFCRHLERSSRRQWKWRSPSRLCFLCGGKRMGWGRWRGGTKVFWEVCPPKVFGLALALAPAPAVLCAVCAVCAPTLCASPVSVPETVVNAFSRLLAADRWR